MKLSKNFSLSEFTKSQAAIRHGINNQPSPEQIESLRALCINVLQPVRDHHGAVVITSGYRSPELNKLIGGSPKSQHMRAEAADIEVSGVSNRELAQWISDNTTFDQLILEFHDPEQGDNSGWVHVSHTTQGINRAERLTASRVNGRVVYAAVENFH